MKTLIKNDSIYSLNNLDNYNAILEADIYDIVSNYQNVIMNYLKHIKENLVPKIVELDLRKYGKESHTTTTRHT